MGNVPVANGICPPNWIQIGNKCYNEYTSGLVTLDGCRTICNSLTPPARLLCITDSTVNAQVRAAVMSPNWVWIGLNDVASEGTYVWPDTCSSTYTNWGQGEPNNQNNVEDRAVVAPSGLWLDVDGASLYACMCEIYTIIAPTAAPVSAPTFQPTYTPTVKSTARPTSQPSSQPSRQPSSQPTVQPTRQPINAPTSQPSSQPTRQPSRQPLSQPSMHPTGQPSSEPTRQPSGQPSSRPSTQPSAQPSGQPSTQPTRQPSTKPSGQPTRRPTSQPSSIPSSQPSSQPSVRPSIQPTAAPTAQPSEQPSGRPSTQPSHQPSSQPSVQPTEQPSSLPTSQPTGQPSAMPSSQPTAYPSGEPTAQPSAQPSVRPSCQPSAQPSDQPSGQPSSVPSSQPSLVPTAQPSAQPSARPSGEPTGQPTSSPSAQPSACPSVQPSISPSGQPSTQPTALPSRQPSCQPTRQPSSQPTSAPSTTGEWTSTNVNGSALFSALSFINGSVWACGGNGATSDHPASCTLASALTGELATEYRFPWDTITSAIVATDNSNVVVSGLIMIEGKESSAIAVCSVEASTRGLTCAVKVLTSVNIVDASYNALARKVVYIGRNSNQAAVTLFDSAANTLSHYVYTVASMTRVEFSCVESPPNFVGSFVAGTSVGSSGTKVIAIVSGWLRSDTGQMAAAIGITPVSGSIVSTAGLVNAMALEATGPDSFIAGGLELSDGAGVHAYLVRANTLYKAAQFGVRYRTAAITTTRRALSATDPASSVARGVALTSTALFMIIDHTNALTNRTSLSVLKLAPATGAILSQAQVSSTSADMHCTDITVAGVLLSIACTVQRVNSIPQSLLIGVNMDLSFIQLPAGFIKNTNATFVAEDVPLKAISLTMTSPRASVTVTDSEVATTNQAPTRRPSAAPSARPSQELSANPTSRPSSSPTSAPSVSPQPSSAPSTSGPTNTHKPTFTATVRPTRSPSVQPTARPSVHPTALPTALPTRQPSTATPSAVPTAAPTVAPTSGPSFRPTRASTVRPSVEVSAAPTPANQSSGGSRDATSPMVISVSVAGAACFALCGLYVLYRRNKSLQNVFKYNKTGKNKLRFDPSTAMDDTSFQVVVVGAGADAMHTPASTNTHSRRILTVRNLRKHRASTLPSRKIQFSDTSSFAISSLHTSECSYSEYKVRKKTNIRNAPTYNGISANNMHTNSEPSDGSDFENSDSSLSSSDSSMCGSAIP